MRISVLGLGRMGAPMARNLLEIGHELVVFDADPARTGELAAKGVKVASTVREAAKEAQVALTMVADDDAELELTQGPEGLLAHLPPGAIHLCTSTIGVETSRELAHAHAQAGQGFVAAPVFGRPGTAASRQLWFMVGGPEAQVSRCLTIFEALGRGTTQVGPRAELAHALKLGGDLLSALMVEGLGEVLAFGEKAGMPPGEYLRLLNTAIFKSPMVDAAGGLILRRMHDPADLTIAAALVETRRAMEAAEELQAVIPAAEWIHQRLEDCAAQGWGAQDLTALSRGCRRSVGLESPEPQDFEELEPASTFMASTPNGEVELEVRKVTHFEIIKNGVWAWTQGKRYRTPWKYLAEVEQTFKQVPFLRIHRHILLQPEAALASRSQARGAQSEDLSQLLAEAPAPEAPREAPREAVMVPVVPSELPAPQEEAGVVLEAPGASPVQELKEAARGLLQRISGLSSHRGAEPGHSHEEPPQRVEMPQRAEETPLVPVPEARPVPEPGRPETGNPDPGRPDPGRPDPGRPDPGRPDPGNPDLDRVSHFEAVGGTVWAWVQGDRVRTTWRSLDEIEAAFSRVVLVRVQRHILVHPLGVQSLKPLFGGRSRVTMAAGIELEASRAATRRLREVLGL